MNLSKRKVSLVLSEDGKTALELAGLRWETAGLLLEVEDSDDMGVWVRIQREEEEHILLVRWDYILTMDFPSEERGIAGLLR